ncbi:THAP-type domain-containing protein, partial [Aphis craccivora]
MVNTFSTIKSVSLTNRYSEQELVCQASRTIRLTIYIYFLEGLPKCRKFKLWKLNVPSDQFFNYYISELDNIFVKALYVGLRIFYIIKCLNKNLSSRVRKNRKLDILSHILIIRCTFNVPIKRIIIKKNTFGKSNRIFVGEIWNTLKN